MLCGELRFCFELDPACFFIGREKMLNNAKLFLSIYRTVSELAICFTVRLHSTILIIYFPF